MTTNNQDATWRIAAKDDQHPLHKATWALFSDRMKVKATARRLQEQKSEVITYATTILRTPELHELEAFGSGNGPINSVRLLGYWQVTEAIPDLIDVLIDDIDEMDVLEIADAAITALSNMGQAAVEPMLTFGEQYPQAAITAASILGTAGRKDPRAFAFIQRTFEGLDRDDRFDADFVSGCLLDCDKEQAVPYLQEMIKKGSFSKDARKAIQQNIDMVPEGYFAERDLY